MKSEKALVIYSFLACLFLMIVGIFSARSTNQLLSAFIYLPLVFFFGTRVYDFYLESASGKSPAKKLDTTALKVETKSISLPSDPEILKGIKDKDKRLFLQLIGTTGISLLIMALFSRKARDTFLGGGAISEAVSIKDSTGKIIDPSKEHPTSGYSIANIDDTHVPAYYAFLKTDGTWYIMQNTSGAFLYAKGNANYSSNWEIRDKLHYDFYNKVFS